MSTLLLALAAAAQAAPAVTPAAPAVRSLKDVPNVTVAYYDVTGKDMKAINKSIQKQRPKDPVTKQPVTGGVTWNLSPSFRRTTTNGVCKITDVTTTFSGKAELPRLTNEAVLPAAIAADWRVFLSSLEQDAAQRLWFVHDRIGGLKTLMMGKDCDQAVKEGSAFLDKLKADASAFRPVAAAPAAAQTSGPPQQVKPNE